MLDHLLHRYGSALRELVTLCEEDPSLARPLEHAPAYLRAEIHYAVSHEGALHLEDLILRRTRLVYEVADKGRAALDEIADIAAPLLGWTEDAKQAEKSAYRARAEAEDAAARQPDDTSAERARSQAPDVAPMQPLRTG